MAEKKEWTLMFYFASDNPLAPGIVSQLKSIKQAGFHPDANVIAQFDPQTVGTPTHIFEVNVVNKSTNPGKRNIGFAGNDPFVRTLMEDKLWKDQEDREGNLIREQIKDSLLRRGFKYNPPQNPPDGKSTNKVAGNGGHREAGPRKSLESFLSFCAEQYPARHYMLFILGHGLAVGNDVFLFDEHADEPSLTLRGLGTVLTNFKKTVVAQKAQFELVSFHSCSVSSLEVAYELKGTAKYMLASQGPAFVGSWPYRQILIRIFNDLVKYKKKIDVKEMLGKIFDYCYRNSADFVLAGYSFDLCLCNLNKVESIKKPLKNLSGVLTEALKEYAAALDEDRDNADPRAKDCILLAHLKAQSYWQESYTDLYDFCFCLSLQCKAVSDKMETKGKTYDTLQAIDLACNMMMDALDKEREESRAKERTEAADKLIVLSDSVGPSYQYSHGLSVFFPWSEPTVDDPVKPFWSKTPPTDSNRGEYQQYKFKETSWGNFLQSYFDVTMRETRKEESDRDPREAGRRRMKTPENDLLEDITNLVFNEEGQLSRSEALTKTAPADPTGDDCTCASIKNYPRDTRARRERRRKAPQPEQSDLISSAFRARFLKR